MSLRIAKWASVRIFQISNNILLNYGACLILGASNKRKKVTRCFSPYRVLKFNADGAAHGKPGPAGHWSCS